MNFLEALSREVLVLDGGMGTMIQTLELTDLDFGGADFRMLSDILTYSRPEKLREIHLEYFRAGAHAVETNTFGASAFRLSEYDFRDADASQFAPIPGGADFGSLSYEELAYGISKRGGEIARDALDAYAQESEYDGRPLFVIGSIGPSNRVISSTDADLTKSTFDEIAKNFYDQVLGLIDGGVDVLLFETQQDILELKAAIIGGRRALAERKVQLPIMAQVTVDQFSRMQIFNTDIHAALVTVQDIGIDVFGINCSIGPDLMEKTVETIARYSKLPISVVPNAGLPVSEDGETVYKFEPDRFAEYQARFVTEYGVNIVGGCCGTGGDHIRALSKAVRGLQPKTREPYKGVFLSGPQEAVEIDSSEGLILVGERLNVRGSKKVREAVEGTGPIDHDALEEVVNEQLRDLGLSIIDMCMDSNLVDTTEALKEVIHRQTTNFSGAASLDSFSHETLAEAIKVYPGRPLINSMSLEEVEPGVTKVEAVIRATRDHCPMYVALAGDERGPAATRKDKHAVAVRIVETAGKFGVRPEQIFIDMNVFPLGSEADPSVNWALESLESIPLIKGIHPDLRTICGVGNLTNGLAKKPYMRKVLTSVWLDEARKRGLDAAIVNPNHYVFVEDLDAKDYDLALKAILEHDMDAFEELETIAEAKKGRVVEKRSSYDDLSLEAGICQKIVDGYKDRQQGSVEVEGRSYDYRDTIVISAAATLQKHEPLDFINDYLMKAMQELGDGFALGEVSLPHLLKSADVMKHVIGFFEEYMKVKSGVELRDEIQYKGVIVVGTVYQDVHSIGKDLAKTLFENYGYRVIDLGVMTPLQKFLDVAKEHNADAIGMSALLVQTSNHMITVRKMMKEQGFDDTYVLIGGAPVSDRHAAYVAMAGEDDVASMDRHVFYCQTAMDGVNVMNELLGGHDTDSVLDRNQEKLVARYTRATRRADEDKALRETLPRRAVSCAKHILPERPWFRPEIVRQSLADFNSRLNKKTLFSLNWKFGGASSRTRRGDTQEVMEELLSEWIAKAGDGGWIQPQGVMGVFPCRSDGDDVVVYDVDEPDRELWRFDFDVVIGSGREDTVSGAQYFYPRTSDSLDAIGVQIASSGAQVNNQIQRFKDEGESESVLYLQGLSDRVAEDMAEYLHGLLRERLGFGDTKRGTRWSPGYPAITNTENNKGILQLLDATESIGVTVTDAGEFFPTGTTAAIVSFHPDARYS